MKCSKVDPCLYCDAVLSSRHEHDHFPIPAEVGGETTFCVCINCHDLKDRIPIDGHMIAPFMNALYEDWPHLSPLTRILLGKMLRAFCVALKNQEAPDSLSPGSGASSRLGLCVAFSRSRALGYRDDPPEASEAILEASESNGTRQVARDSHCGSFGCA